MTFQYQGSVTYTCPLTESKCSYVTPLLAPCGKMSVVGPYCPAHAAVVHGVAVRPSRIPHAGWGLFATRQFYAPMTVVEYTGERLTQAMVDLRYGRALYDFGPFCVTVCRDVILDSAGQRCLAAYINDAHESTFHNNTRWSVKYEGEIPHLRLLATTDIKIDDEIFVAYGKDYWECMTASTPPQFSTQYETPSLCSADF